MKAKFTILFWLVLSLYIFTLIEVSYVGVYLTYIAIPLLAFLGFLAMVWPKNKGQQTDAEYVLDKATSNLKSLAGDAKDLLNDINHRLENYINEEESKKIENKKTQEELCKNQKND